MSDNEEEVSINPRRQKKLEYGRRLLGYLAEFKNILLLNIDNVGSSQLQEVRIALRGRATFLMGKNTIIRRVLRDAIEAGQSQYEVLLPYIVGNVGFCFTNENLNTIRKEVTQNQVPAPARTGAFAPVDVFIPPGPTPLDPGQTAFFQALNIATKISRGAIEIINKVHLVKANERVSASAVALLTKLQVKPFFFGIKVTHVYEDGAFYDAKVLDLDEAQLLNKFFAGVASIASISLAINVPSEASLPHNLGHGFQKLLAIALVTGYIFEEAKIFKEFLDNPDAFAAAAAPAAGEEAAAEAAPVEEETDSDDDDAAAAAGGLFDDDDDEGY